MTIVDSDGLEGSWWEEQLRALAFVEPEFGDLPVDVTGHTRIVAGTIQGFIRLSGLVDVEAERARLEKSIVAVRADLERSEAKLANESYRSKAPADIVAKESAKADELRHKVDKLQAQLGELGG